MSKGVLWLFYEKFSVKLPIICGLRYDPAGNGTQDLPIEDWML